LFSIVEKRQGEVINHFPTFCDTHTPTERDPAILGEQWISLGAALRLDGYTKNFKEVHGPESESCQEPFDVEVAMLAGGSLKNGWLWVSDGSVPIENLPTLSELRASRTSSQPAIERHPQPVV
jgi:hypothetical protein